MEEKHEDQVEFFHCPLCNLNIGNSVDGSEEHECLEAKPMNNHPEKGYDHKFVENMLGECAICAQRKPEPHPEVSWEKEFEERWYLHTKQSNERGGYDYIQVGAEVEEFIKNLLSQSRKEVVEETTKALKEVLEDEYATADEKIHDILKVVNELIASLKDK